MAASFNTLYVVSLTFVQDEIICIVEQHHEITVDANHVTATTPDSLHLCSDDTLYHSMYKRNTKHMPFHYITPKVHTDRALRLLSSGL